MMMPKLVELLNAGMELPSQLRYGLTPAAATSGSCTADAHAEAAFTYLSGGVLPVTIVNPVF
jgi:hypothetical protein